MACQTVFKAQMETKRLPEPPRVVMQSHDMHKHITDLETIREYHFEALHFIKTSLLVRGGRL